MVYQSPDKSKHSIRKRYSPEFKNRIRDLRMRGWTHREIGKKFSIAYSSAAEWTRDIIISPKQKIDIQRRKASRVITLVYRANLSRKISAYFSLHPRFKYSREILLARIKDFYAKNSRIPLKRELNMFREFKRLFGSWNGAIRAAGFNPNPELFSHKFISNDGHKCDSFTEKVIDDYLFHYKIAHSRNFRYGNTKMTADFYLGENRILEFFGLAREQKKYDQIILRKRYLAKQLNLKLIEAYPEDIYPENRLLNLL